MANKVYKATVKHEGLKKYKEIIAYSKSELNEKKRLTLANWEEEWKKKCEYEEKIKKQEREKKLQEIRQEQIRQKISSAHIYTKNLQEEQYEILNYLKRTLNLTFEKEKLFRHKHFEVPRPMLPKKEIIPREPKRADDEFNKIPVVVSKFFPKKAKEIEAENEKNFKINIETGHKKSIKLFKGILQSKIDIKMS